MEKTGFVLWPARDDINMKFPRYEGILRVTRSWNIRGKAGIPFG
jgi:hypothetical protein